MAAKKKAPRKKPDKPTTDPCAWLKTQGFGRPSKLKDEVARVFIGAIERGHYIEHAAPLAGISASTAFSWLSQGTESDQPAGSIFVHFLEAVKRAQAQSVDDDLNIIDARKDGWQARAWKLERRLARFWGRVDYVELKDREKTLGDDLTDREILAARFSKEDQDARGPSEVSQNGNGRRHTNGKK